MENLEPKNPISTKGDHTLIGKYYTVYLSLQLQLCLIKFRFMNFKSLLGTTPLSKVLILTINKIPIGDIKMNPSTLILISK
jgi:hypothetical protein